MGKSENSDFSGTIEACDLKGGSCRSRSFLYHIFPGFLYRVIDEALIAETAGCPNFFLMNVFLALKGSKRFLLSVCFVFYLAKISGERLHDHWSSGSPFLHE